MYCPNCGAENKKKQNYCRYCGLHLQDIERSYLNQLVFGEDTKLLKKLRSARKTSDSAQYFSVILMIVGIITMFLSDSAMGKILITGSLLSFFWVQIIREAVGYIQRRHLERNDLENITNNKEQREFRSRETNKLIEEKPFIPVSSVTENSTELLFVDRKSNSSE